MTASSRLSPCRTPPGVWRVALLLTVVLYTLLLLNNRDYLFATKLYENADWAADSLLVREALHGPVFHGHYSQWHFYHPGPALIDTLAAGEALFYDALHVVPTPYNGQLLALGLVTTLAFSLALSIGARQLGSGGGGYLFFLPLALGFACWHYGTVGVQVVLNALPAFPLILVFLCFLVAAAAVGAGSGAELPVLVGAGGWLVHNHAAQLLFVVPLALLAYAGLLTACRRQAEQTPTGARWVTGTLAAGWRAFPQAHRVGTILLGLFVLPLALEALRGRDSNFVYLFNYLRTGPKPGPGLPGSLGYFLTFGSYDTFRPGHRRFEYRGWSSIGLSLANHWQAYTLWLLALVGSPAIFFAARQRFSSHDENNECPSERRTFVGWFYGVLAASFSLTLVWGIRQGGQMDFYNAYFDYSIYFGLTLGLAAAMAVALMAWTDFAQARRARPIISALCWAGTVWTGISQANHFNVIWTYAFRSELSQASSFGTPRDAALADTVKRAAADLPPGATCLLGFDPWENWRSATAVALQLERLGYRVRVSEESKIMFGEPRTIQRDALDPAVPLVRWMVVPQSIDPVRLSRWPLLAGASLDASPLSEVDPAEELISFRPHGNYHQFAFYGWSDSGAAWSWSDQRSALLAFHALPLPTEPTFGVELFISAWNAPLPHAANLQRVVLQFNGQPLGTFHLPMAGPNTQPVRVLIPRAQWQRAAARHESLLQFVFPDAKSPAELGVGDDLRRIGGAFRSVEFRPAPSEPALVSLLEDGRSADGWCGADTAFVLPGESAGPELLRLRGQVPAEFGFHYPLSLVCEFADGQRQTCVLPHPGAFEEVITAPPSPDARPVALHLLAAQTYRPSQHDARSPDSRDLSVRLDRPECVTAAQPLLVTREAGWYDPETDGSISWRWTNGQSTLAVLAQRAGTLVLEAGVRSALGDNAVEGLVDGKLAVVTPCPAGEWQPVSWRLPVAMGSHRLTLRSRLPAVQPAGDSRALALQVKDLRWRLEP